MNEASDQFHALIEVREIIMLQSKLDVLTTTALQSDTIYGEFGLLKKKEQTNSIIYGPALLLLLAACGGGGGGCGGTVSVSSPEPADTDDTPAEEIHVKVGAGLADADGVHRATINSTKIDIDASWFSQLAYQLFISQVMMVRISHLNLLMRKIS